MLILMPYVTPAPAFIKPRAFFVTSPHKSYNSMHLIFPIHFFPSHYCLDAEPLFLRALDGLRNE